MVRLIGHRLFWLVVGAAVPGLALAVAQAERRSAALDPTAEGWVQSTLAAMTLDAKVGQLLAPGFSAVYTSSDSDTFEDLAALVREYHVGGFVVFGGAEPTPGVLLNPGWPTTTLGQPLAAASLANRLQALSKIPLLNSADFETGPGFRLRGATTFPRAMAFGAAGDERLAYRAGRVTAAESRALGIQLDFAPVVDVNNNPRNPVINTRSFGEDPAMVGNLASAMVRGMQEGGVLATLKHFPGHGDTEVDSHLGLPVIDKPRERLERLELVPFRLAIDAGAGAVMTAHMALPQIDATPNTPATLSQPAVTGLLRHQMAFDGLIVTDSMEMAGITKLYDPGEAAVRAVQAGNDIVLHSPDVPAAFRAVKAAVERGDISASRIDQSVERILRAKARLGLHEEREVDLARLPEVVGSRVHRSVADEVSRRSMTLVKDEGAHVPLGAPRDAAVLYLSVLDYPSNWGIGAPSRTFVPELKTRWPNVTAIELSDRTSKSELDIVRAMATRYDAIVAGVFVRTASASGRMDLAGPVVSLLRDLAGVAAQRRVPYVAVLFGNPYVAIHLQELPALMLTYDYYDLAERSAVRALAGEAPIGGRLPIALPGFAPRGAGLTRDARSSAVP
ncbi:MAG: glycoside hydrolase family 3 protein [Vicinamibacteraceae bacterium]